MIYDVTMFYNEFRLLELRLKMNYDFVDKFIIVESPYTFMNQRKELQLSNDLNFIKEYQDKVILITADYSGAEYEESCNFYKQLRDGRHWLNEHWQRDAGIILSNLKFDYSDYIICSDLDEIYNKKVLSKLITGEPITAFSKLSMYMSYFYLNTKLNCSWDYPFIINGDLLNQFNGRLTFFRNYAKPEFIIDNAGWHFSNLGDLDFVANKHITNAHAPEYGNTPIETIKSAMTNIYDIAGRYTMETLKDLTFLPEEILNNLDNWKGYIR